MQVSLKNGKERWILIHAEAQGYDDKNFPECMFQTFYRLRDRYHKDSVSIVLYTSPGKKHHASEYRNAFLGKELIYQFHAFSLVDYTPAKLRETDNIFSIIMEAAWYNLNLKNVSDEERLRQKMTVVNRLRRSEYSVGQIKKLVDFIKYYVTFQKRDNDLKFEEVFYKNAKPMGITEGILNQVKTEGKFTKAKIAIKNLRSKGFSTKEIAEVLELEEAKVKEFIVELFGQ